MLSDHYCGTRMDLYFVTVYNALIPQGRGRYDDVHMQG